MIIQSKENKIWIGVNTDEPGSCGTCLYVRDTDMISIDGYSLRKYGMALMGRTRFLKVWYHHHHNYLSFEEGKKDFISLLKEQYCDFIS